MVPRFRQTSREPTVRDVGLAATSLPGEVYRVRGVIPPGLPALSPAKSVYLRETPDWPARSQREFLPHGIRINAVSPGPIDTGILERALPKEAAAQPRAQMTESNPMKRFGHPGRPPKRSYSSVDATFTTGANSRRRRCLPALRCRACEAAGYGVTPQTVRERVAFVCAAGQHDVARFDAVQRDRGEV